MKLKLYEIALNLLKSTHSTHATQMQRLAFNRTSKFFEYSFIFSELTDEGIDIIFDEISQAPDPRIITDSNIYISSLGGKLKEIPAESSPFPFRQAE